MSGPNTEKAILPFPSIDRLESASYPWKRVVGERRDTLVREGEEERDEEDADDLTRRMEGVSFIETSGEDARDGGEVGVRASRGKRMLPLVSVHLVETLSHCSPMFVYREDSKPRRFLTEPSVPVYNNLFDNENHDYILAVNDVIESPIGERYLILDSLGSGTFGQVAKCQCRDGSLVAVKVVKNKENYFKQAQIEVAILEKLNSVFDVDDTKHIVRLLESFTFRHHLCLVFELLSLNLFEVIKSNHYRGYSTNLIRLFLKQLLESACILEQAGIIHCDLKPENILLKEHGKPAIKVIDFGSACYEGQTVYSYIQSRFYRSPEVILGLEYSSRIDIWSLGCIAAELLIGLPLFPGQSGYDQIRRIIEALGDPPASMLEKGKNAMRYFKIQYVDKSLLYHFKTAEEYISDSGTQIEYGKQYYRYTKLEDIIKHAPLPDSSKSDPDKEMKQRTVLLDFLRGVLHWDPDRRWSASQAILHPFISGESFEGAWAPPVKSASIPVPRRNKIRDSVHQNPPVFGLSPGSWRGSFSFTGDSLSSSASSSTVVYGSSSSLERSQLHSKDLLRESVSTAKSSLSQSLIGAESAQPRAQAVSWDVPISGDSRRTTPSVSSSRSEDGEDVLSVEDSDCVSSSNVSVLQPSAVPVQHRKKRNRNSKSSKEKPPSPVVDTEDFSSSGSIQIPSSGRGDANASRTTAHSFSSPGSYTIPSASSLAATPSSYMKPPIALAGSTETRNYGHPVSASGLSAVLGRGGNAASIHNSASGALYGGPQSFMPNLSSSFGNPSNLGSSFIPGASPAHPFGFVLGSLSNPGSVVGSPSGPFLQSQPNSFQHHLQYSPYSPAASFSNSSAIPISANPAVMSDSGVAALSLGMSPTTSYMIGLRRQSNGSNSSYSNMGMRGPHRDSPSSFEQSSLQERPVAAQSRNRSGTWGGQIRSVPGLQSPEAPSGGRPRSNSRVPGDFSLGSSLPDESEHPPALRLGDSRLDEKSTSSKDSDLARSLRDVEPFFPSSYQRNPIPPAPKTVAVDFGAMPGESTNHDVHIREWSPRVPPPYPTSNEHAASKVSGRNQSSLDDGSSSFLSDNTFFNLQVHAQSVSEHVRSLGVDDETSALIPGDGRIPIRLSSASPESSSDPADMMMFGDIDR